MINIFSTHYLSNYQKHMNIKNNRNAKPISGNSSVTDIHCHWLSEVGYQLLIQWLLISNITFIHWSDDMLPLLSGVSDIWLINIDFPINLTDNNGVCNRNDGIYVDYYWI